MNTVVPLDDFEAARMVADVLKRVPSEAQQRVLRWAQEKAAAGDAGANSKNPGAAARHELSDLLQDPAFVQRHGVVNRMLDILSAAHRLKPALFDKVLSIQGRNRTYFAKSEAEITSSGKSTQPRNIPGTGYWIMTNSPTSQKREMLGQVLRLLGFSPAAIKDAVAAIVE